MKSILLFLALVAALLALPLLLPVTDDARHAVPAEGAPWQIESLPDGSSRVFGLTLGRSTLNDARARFGHDARVAMVVAPGESGAIEAYYESVTTGPVSGKMVLTLGTTLEQREQMLSRSNKTAYMEGATRRVDLGAADLARAGTLPIVGIVFIPAAQLDEPVVLERFGAPAERIPGGKNREHFLYPDKGLDLQLDAQGKEVLQYVAPRDFAHLRAPLTGTR